MGARETNPIRGVGWDHKGIRGSEPEEIRQRIGYEDIIFQEVDNDLY